jgi:outer membrane protein OmpA-like peptidoglycan-associated protein
MEAQATEPLSAQPKVVAPEKAVDAARSELIASDFADAMVQLPGLAPGQTRLRVTAPNTLFADQMIATLRAAGYELRLVSMPAEGVLDYKVSVDETAGDDSEAYTFLVSAEAVQLKRSYQVDPEGLQPVTPMFVRGVSSDGVVMDASRFDEVAVRRVIAAGGIALAEKEASDRVEQAAKAADDEVPNFSETGQSRYSQQLRDYEVVKSYTMEFGNDSMVLDSNNRRAVQQIAAGYNAASDVISVIACSHGRTALANGNAVLALGRAQRIKEAFVRAGIDSEQVLEEGCWADSHHDNMPRRGAVVTHQRLVQ